MHDDKDEGKDEQVYIVQRCEEFLRRAKVDIMTIQLDTYMLLNVKCEMQQQ